MRYYTGTKLSHCSRFHEISNSNLNISWLQFSWDITLCSQYLIVDDFMRYYNRTKISHVCRFHEIFHRNLNISWLHISRLRFRLAHHRTALRYFLFCSKAKFRKGSESPAFVLDFFYSAAISIRACHNFCSGLTLRWRSWRGEITSWKLKSRQSFRPKTRRKKTYNKTKTEIRTLKMPRKKRKRKQ